MKKKIRYSGESAFSHVTSAASTMGKARVAFEFTYTLCMCSLARHLFKGRYLSGALQPDLRKRIFKLYDFAPYAHFLRYPYGTRTVPVRYPYVPRYQKPYSPYFSK